MNFEELSDDEWTSVASLIADEPLIRLNRRGRPRAEPRVVANAVLWILSTGESWSRLPARYPSGPTCRRRFDEWHESGTLLEIVRRLTVGGRQFVYVPEPVAPAARDADAQASDDDGLPSVYWKSPEAWQASPSVADTLVADPIERITRELAPSGPAGPVGPSGSTGVAQPVAQPVTQTVVAQPVTQAVTHAVPVRVSTSVSIPAPVSMCVPMIDGVMPPVQYDGVMPAIPPAQYDDSAAAARSALWTSDGPQSVQVVEWRGYVMNLEVQPVRNGLYRAAVEILKDDKRVERSGLIGPPFEDLDEARQFAFDWARDWIDRECGPSVTPTPSSGGTARSTFTCAASAANSPVSPVSPVVTRAMPSAASGLASGVRLAPVQRYSAQSALKPANDSREVATTATATSAERRSVDLPWRPEPRPHLG